MMEVIEIKAEMDYGNQLYGIARGPTISIGDCGRGDLWGQSTVPHWALPCISPALYFNESCCVRQAMCAGVRARLASRGGGGDGGWERVRRKAVSQKRYTNIHSLSFTGLV